MNSGHLDGMLVVIVDVTQEIARAKEDQVQREVVAAFQRMMRDRSGFLSFHSEMTELINGVCGGKYDKDIVVFKRIVHTIKGNAAVFGLERISGLCHQIEDQMAETRDLPTEGSMEILQNAWRTLTESVIAPSSDKLSKVPLPVPREELNSLASSLRNIPDAKHLARQIDAWKLEPIQVPLRRLAEQATGMAKRLGKGEVQVDVQAEMIRCDPKRWAPFWSDIVHVVRNAVDHGIESPDERAAAGKGKAVIKFAAGWEGDDLVITISDNGRGIAFDDVREKAKALGIPCSTHEDLVAALFVDGVSTATSVTDMSGRGVGMSAVRSRVESMNGKILLGSGEGGGTTWTFRFARPNADDPGSSLAPPPRETQPRFAIG
jgi:two-component system chemotaxis sensor kinase CheA